MPARILLVVFHVVLQVFAVDDAGLWQRHFSTTSCCKVSDDHEFSIAREADAPSGPELALAGGSASIFRDLECVGFLVEQSRSSDNLRKAAVANQQMAGKPSFALRSSRLLARPPHSDSVRVLCFVSDMDLLLRDIRPRVVQSFGLLCVNRREGAASKVRE